MAPLARDLARLRHEDLTPALPALALPLLALDGETDPILPPALRATTFAGAPHVVRQSRAGHGHMLPESDPAWCAATIRTFLQDIQA